MGKTCQRTGRTGTPDESDFLGQLFGVVRRCRTGVLDNFETYDVVACKHIVADITDTNPGVRVDHTAARLDRMIAKPNFVRAIIEQLSRHRPLLLAGIGLARRCKPRMELVETSLDTGELATLHLCLHRTGMTNLVQHRPARARCDGQGKQKVEPRAFSSAAGQIQREAG